MLRVEHISKAFSGVQALHDVSISFESGTVHVLCGENGAGKSTLMKIIVGNLQPDAGTIFWKGQPVQLTSIQEAQSQGMAIVYQERSLVDSLSVAENIFPQNAPRTHLGFIDFTKLYQQTATLLQQLDLHYLSPRTLVARLSSAQKQMVEIAKALATNPSLLILDEPTASFTQHETEILFNIVQQLKAKGVAVIYITHRMAEIEQLGDVVSVLKDGQYQGTKKVSETTPDELIRMMVGRELVQIHMPSHVQTDVKLRVENLSGRGFRNISFSLHAGEILGFAGLEGSGRTALARALFGDVPITGGTFSKAHIAFSFSHPADAIKNGLAYLPDDRKGSGLFLEKTVAENIAVTHLEKGVYRKHRSEVDAQALQHSLNIKTPSVRQVVRKLSGGNQQKIVLAKWLSKSPDVFILNEPTHSVDVGTKGELYGLLKKLTAAGKSILLISSDLPELLLLSDRIAVLYRGELQGILNRAEATEEKLTALASGIKI